MGNNFIKAMRYNDTMTANLMPAHSSSDNDLIDLLITLGDSEFASRNYILNSFAKAWKSSPRKSLVILFMGRDIETGQGKRRPFRLIAQKLLTISWFQEQFTNILINENNILNNIIRVDDLVCLAHSMLDNSLTQNPNIDKILNYLFSMIHNKQIGSLVAKWMPRKESKYSRLVRYMRKHNFILTFSHYRHLISSHTNVVEQQMCANDWSNIKLEKCSSNSLFMYRKSFYNQGILKPFLKKVSEGTVNLNAKGLTPQTIVKSIFNGIHTKNIMTRATQTMQMNNLYEAQWQNLKQLDNLPQEFNILPIIDVSESMCSPNHLPISTALGLGLFIAERNPNPTFRDYFITFSSIPKFQKVEGTDITTKIENALKPAWGSSTNLELVFDLILNKAKENNVPADSMPSHIIIFSDMQFNYCIKSPSSNAWEMISQQYRDAGYEMPNIIFWNINNSSVERALPVKANEPKTILISGSTQNIFNYVLQKKYNQTLSVLDLITEDERYKHITLN